MMSKALGGAESTLDQFSDDVTSPQFTVRRWLPTMLRCKRPRIHGSTELDYLRLRTVHCGQAAADSETECYSFSYDVLMKSTEISVMLD